MSLNSCIDIVIQIDSVRTIELISQGLFYLKFSISHESSNQVLHGYPYNIVVYSKQSKSIISPSSIDTFSYNSQIFVIKFNDELIELNELCIFRIENSVLLPLPELTLNCKIFHSPASILWDLNTLQELSQSFDKFIEIFNEDYIIHNYSAGFHQFLPINLNNDTALNIATCIHSFLCGYSFHLKETAEAVQYSKLSPKELKNPEFKKIISRYFFNSNKLSKNELFSIYKKAVIFLAEYYEKTKKTLSKFWGDNGNEAFRLKDLSCEIDRFNRTFSGDLRHANDSFILMEVAEVIDPFARGIFSLTKHLSNLQVFFIKTLQTHSNKCIKGLISIYDKQQINLLKKRQILTQFSCQDFSDIPNFDFSLRPEIANEFRNLAEDEYKKLNIYPKDILKGQSPFIFVDIASKSSSLYNQTSSWISLVKKVNKNRHLVVLVHGLHGNSMDMKILKNQLSTFFPFVNILVSFYNEGKTEGRIQKMGKRLAEEIRKYISDHFYDSAIEKISFIGYSLGGLIIRSALEHMIDELPKIHFLITLSTPHLGCHSDTSNLVKAGLWIMKTLKRSKSISQISLADQKSPKNSYLAQLSHSKSISFFKHVSFISSFQDKYSPVHSSRAELISNKSSHVQNEIACNILRNLRCQDLIRIDANFVLGNTFDNAIGRAAHIEMIENKLLIEQILHECRGFF